MYSALSAVLKVLHFRSLYDTDADADALPVYGSWLLSSCSPPKIQENTSSTFSYSAHRQTNRLEHLGLMCLHTRRIRSDLIDTYKITNGIYNVKTELFFYYDQSGRRGHSKKLFKRRSMLHIRKFAFSNRIVDRWNSLSECCVTCNSINCFKSHISNKLEPETTWSVDIRRVGFIWH